MENVIFDNYEMYEDDGEIESYWFEEEESNLNIPLNNEVIIAFADTGEWFGRGRAATIFKNNVNEILSCCPGCDYRRIYSDGRNIRGEFTHHDGTHKVLFRIAPYDKAESIVEKIIYKDGLTDMGERVPYEEGYFTKATKSLSPTICNVYGWEYDKRNKLDLRKESQ